MLSDLIRSGFGNEEDLNCAEKILYGANQVYNLGINQETFKIAAGFGGGMGIESVCGALTAGVMVLSRLFATDYGHNCPKIKELNKELFSAFQKEMKNIDCAPLKNDHRTEELKCHNVILKAAEVLDAIVIRELQKDSVVQK